ncbi:similar to Saccharomyces cerevisiae YMR318C ADH6 NADPH-dependent medium chain alcohol dehydrogenase with broad substrate specificity [Maudiozyma barnettii]|uniref:alcohol dehydrogenase (NADP(+)) n=1 Tax=Maudiozyma barnettii TaxID=61262 RepID=A0A8H2VK01_9SACH|nr:uncharacterized protein KABA2_11S03300 [Kazachstania barnettii]CAB4256786.1 similar to Saccharomyces cerevisiae YMR318C ADH6 NADPH-dependent medium chain alcohol dehydrogenase with broad substrate specificity [Kazachstania barnettii]CAD1785439.1 similar to Saccharomyces cerevisiae YMR318C ADH6 NADPH-dependent medium chain alcohol dehydrogenase with broad substrate specificity [Kazachstania barnettii]
MPYPEEFTGIGVISTDSWRTPQRVTYPAKSFDPRDIDIQIDACGVCGSDLHTVQGHWRPIRDKMVVGHEIVGTVVAVGSQCNSGFKIGDRVGVGAQVLSCLECERCEEGNEPYCAKFVSCYNRPYDDGYVSQGGYASHVRVHEHFVIPIPESIPSELAAPLLCGGITVYSPLRRNGCGTGKRVGIVGIGGLGHMAVLFAKAMGAEVWAFSRRNNKREDALNLGADHYIATSETPGWDSELKSKLDLVLVCASSLSDIELDKYVSSMRVGGKIISVCIPEKHEKLSLSAFGLAGVHVSNSALGSPEEIRELLALVAEKGIKIWVETLPVGESGVSEALQRLDKGDVRYRFTLVDFDKEFPRD